MINNKMFVEKKIPHQNNTSKNHNLKMYHCLRMCVVLFTGNILSLSQYIQNTKTNILFMFRSSNHLVCPSTVILKFLPILH